MAHCFWTKSANCRPQARQSCCGVLEDREVAPVGSSTKRKIDVRLVAATNSELEDMVECRAFRADLYYRLNVVRIELPPLRERPEDIGPILDHFIAQHNRRCELNVGRPDPQLLARMRRYDWPGNVRELRNMVEAMFVDPPCGRSVGVADLPPSFRRLFTEQPRAGQQERERLAEVMRETNWKQGGRCPRAELVADDAVPQAGQI